MLIVVKIFLVAFAVFGQAKLFQEKPEVVSVEGGLDSLALPLDKPELVLAKRAMEAQGLCAAEPAHDSVSRVEAAAVATEGDRDSTDDVASLCF